VYRAWRFLKNLILDRIDRTRDLMANRVPVTFLCQRIATVNAALIGFSGAEVYELMSTINVSLNIKS
jgi:hypothetical protein